MSTLRFLLCGFLIFLYVSSFPSFLLSLFSCSTISVKGVITDILLILLDIRYDPSHRRELTYKTEETRHRVMPRKRFEPADRDIAICAYLQTLPSALIPQAWDAAPGPKSRILLRKYKTH